MIQAVLKRDEFHWSWLSVDRLQEQTDCNLVREFVEEFSHKWKVEKRVGNIDIPGKRIEKKLRRRFLDITLLIRARACGHTIKKAEHQRIRAFKLWCWRRLLRVPWTARRAHLSILKEINPEYWKD